MKVSWAKTLLNSISRFGSLSSTNTLKIELAQRYYLKTEKILKILKPVFEEVIISELASDEELDEVLKELDAFINEARELMENWHQMTSKVYFVMQIEAVMTKLLTSALETCRLIKSSISDNSSSCVEKCMQELQQIHCEQTSYIIEEVVRAQLDNTAPQSEHLEGISKSLNLLSNIEFLMEAIALDKLKTEVRRSENHAGVEDLNQLITLINYMHDNHVEINQLKSINGVPIPDDFCCPLSLELMSDPVIVASGQTYERAFIKQWLDKGCNVCPKTRQTLSNTNLVTNYNVKDLIVNWCESNDIEPPDPIKYKNLVMPAVFLSLSDPSTNGSIISHTSQSPSGDHPKSPNIPIEDSISSDGVHQGTRLHEKSTYPPHNPISLGSPLHIANDASGEVSEDASTVSSSQREQESEPMVAETRSRNQTIWGRASKSFIPRINQTIKSGPDLSTVEKQVRKLIEDLKSDSVDVQRAATAELRLLARPNMENRIIIANCGGIELLVQLLHSTDPKTQENSVTALLNLSINDNNKTVIANADAIDPLIHVLETGNSDAKENAAATLLSLSVIEENKARIGRSRAIKPLVELLGNGTPRGKKDAASALFNLSIFHGNKAQIVDAGAVKHLVELMDPAAGMVDKVVPVLANLSTIPEGRTAIGNEGGIPFLVDIVEVGSARAKEHAAAALLQLCTNNNRFCTQVLREGAGPPLVVLSITGTARAKEKAQNLLSYFRNLRHGNVGRP